MKQIIRGILLCLSAVIFSVGANAQTNYSNAKLKKENLGRGLIAIRKDSAQVYISWRYLSTDPLHTTFNIYRNGTKINKKPIAVSTQFTDQHKNNKDLVYEVRPVTEGKENGHKNGSYTLPAHAPVGYLPIPLNQPEGGITPSGEKYTYQPNDASVGDVDGDGEYEIILKWEPSNTHDNAHDGYTGPVLLDCYTLKGKHLWRINLGINIRAGAHYTQFMVYDLDGDGKAEVVMRTADGTTDAKGTIIGDPTADFREAGIPSANPKERPRNQGRILKGKEYLSVFSGLTGEVLQSIDYIPQRGNPMEWGDNRANRSDRFLACIAYLDGINPSVVMCRGYYTRTVLAAFDWNGKELKNRWVFDTNKPEYKDYAGQGNHNLRVADVDGDGFDEIIYGSCTIDHNGKGLYNTGLGHGDAIHLTQFDPASPKLQIWACHENKKDGSTFRDAATGKIIFQLPDNSDVGRCMAADIDPTNYGVEMWSSASGGIRNIKSEVIATNVRRLPTNMAVWWDGDLLREMLNGTTISKYNWKIKGVDEIIRFEGTLSNNGSKSNPCLHGDIMGDWREEALLRSADNTSLHLYTSSIPTDYRFHTFLEDIPYRISIATQNVGYNQPTQPGFYFGPDLKGLFRGYVFK